ncbi:Rv1733c family protein [Streptomyces albicerus]|uniref:Rv1733c family protein n=1 Tax=Streptomyces albicerus TaxID=2569859 RepID=UPI00124AED3A|nr:hypothetical protein [Streptomyces albicerus]
MRKIKRTKVRGWRWRRNALRRHSDAVEARIVLGTWVLVVIGGTVAGVVGASAMDDTVERQRAQLRPVSAVVAADAPSGAHDVATGAVYDRVLANVRWTDGDGTVRTDRAKVRSGATVGAMVQVWADRYDHLVSEPLSPAEAVTRIVLAGTGAAAAGGSFVLVGGRLARWRVERRATERWGEEWDRVGPKWARKTG